MTVTDSGSGDLVGVVEGEVDGDAVTGALLGAGVGETDGD